MDLNMVSDLVCGAYSKVNGTMSHFVQVLLRHSHV